MLIFAISAVQASQFVKITLPADEVIVAKLEKLHNDTLYLYALNDQNQKRQIPITEIVSLINLQEPTPLKYFFPKLNQDQKIAIINALIHPDQVKELDKQSAIQGIYAEIEYVDYELQESKFNVEECKLRGVTFASTLRVKLNLVLFDKNRKQGTQ